MRTPKEYKENLANGIVTVPMIEDVLFSYNKRAKNWRDKAREYRQKSRYNYYLYDKYGNEEKAEEKMMQLYEKKSDILALCSNQLTAIHKIVHSRKERIEDTEDEFDKYIESIEKYKRGEKSDVVYMNNYYSRDYDDFVTFINVIVEEAEFYLYYEFEKHSFHSPIDEESLSEYPGVEVVELDELNTYGEDINELLPLPFCDSVWRNLTNKTKV